MEALLTPSEILRRHAPACWRDLTEQRSRGVQDIQKRRRARKIAKAAGKLVPKHDHLAKTNAHSLRTLGCRPIEANESRAAPKPACKAAKSKDDGEKAANPGLLKRFSKKDVKLSDDRRRRPPSQPTLPARNDAPAVDERRLPRRARRGLRSAIDKKKK